MNITDDGDNFISTHDRQMWSLVYDVLIRYECPVTFKEFGPNAPRGIDLYLTFFVPKDHDRCDEVIQYLKRELEPLERKGEYVPNGTGQEDYYWGTVCQIHKYSGPDIYIDQITSHVMAEQYSKYLHDKIREWRAKGNSQVN